MLNYGRLTTQTTEVSMEEKFTAIDGLLMVFRIRFSLEFSKTSDHHGDGPFVYCRGVSSFRSFEHFRIYYSFLRMKGVWDVRECIELRSTFQNYTTVPVWFSTVCLPSI